MANNTGKKYGGREAGTPNQLTKELREVYSEFINNNQNQIQLLFDKVSKENPSKAIDVILKMSEFVIPKIKQTTNIIQESDKPQPPMFGSYSLED